MSVVGARLAGLTDLSTVQTALRHPTISHPRVSVCGVWLSNAACLPAYRPVALAIVGARPPAMVLLLHTADPSGPLYIHLPSQRRVSCKF